jgi:hypothetical protein
MKYKNNLDYISPNNRLSFLKSIISAHFPFTEKKIETFIQMTIDKPDTGYYHNGRRQLAYLDFDALSINTSTKWSEDLILKRKVREDTFVLWDFKQNLNWAFLSVNDKLPWSIEFIEKNKERIRWKKNNIVFDISIFDNLGIKWDTELIEKFIINTELDNFSTWASLSGNPSLQISSEFLDKYENKLFWSFISKNSALPLNDDFYNKYHDKLEWRFISRNPKLPRSNSFFDKYKDKIDLQEFSVNTGFDWTEEFIIKNEDVLDWGALAGNTSINWNHDFILENINRFRIHEISLINTNWTIEFIEKIKNKIDWKGLSAFFKSSNYDEILKKYLPDLLWFKIDSPNDYKYRGTQALFGISGNKNIFKEYFDNMEVEDLVDLLFQAEKDCKNSSGNINHNDLHQNFFNQNTYYQYDDTEFCSFDDDPNYNPEADFDQQGPDFDF